MATSRSSVPVGQLLVDLVVDQRLSCVIDLSGFDSDGAKKAFLLDFARRLYLRNEAPLHLFLEEADDSSPGGRCETRRSCCAPGRTSSAAAARLARAAAPRRGRATNSLPGVEAVRHRRLPAGRHTGGAGGRSA